MVIKRGVLFSLISILLSTFFIILFWGANTARLDTTSGSVETRITVMDHYISSFDAYVADTARLSTRSALIEITDNTALSPSAYTVEEMANNISECLLTGKTRLNGVAFNCSQVGNDNFRSRIDNYTYIGEKELGINTEYLLEDQIDVEDGAPFEVIVTFYMNYTVNDSFSRWNRSVHHRVVVSVIGLPDPLFSRYAQGYLIESAWKRNITSFPILRELLKPKNVSDIIAQQAYVSNRDMSPTYLERLAGIISGDLDPDNRSGIETLIDPATLALSVEFPFNRSMTAHQIFNNHYGVCGDEIFGINVTDFAYPKFRLDVPHLVRYNVSNSSLYNVSCS